MLRVISSLVFSTPFLLACAASPTAPDLRGEWGGTEASLTLSSAGGAASYPCGAGTIDSGWKVNAVGRFGATGRHSFSGGPMLPQGTPAYAARYQGHFIGDSLEYVVILPDLGDTLGPFHLIRGGPVVQLMCV